MNKAFERPTHRESGEDRRAAIAEAARTLIVEKGLEGLRTRDIADRVGINIATLHYHVPSKEALVALVTETMKLEFQAQSRSRPRAHLSPADQLEHEFDDFRELLTERSELLALMNELIERGRRDPVVDAAMRPLLCVWREMLSGILAAGRDDGSFRADMDPGYAALMLIGAMIGFCRNPDPSLQNFERYRAELRRAVRNPITPVKD
jgi:AcrR family transcriptional regulator